MSPLALAEALSEKYIRWNSTLVSVGFEVAVDGPHVARLFSLL